MSFWSITGLKKALYGLSSIIKVLEAEYGPPFLTSSHTLFSSLKKRGFSMLSRDL